MTATHQPFTFYAGADWAFDVACHDANGAPLNLSGAAIAWRLHQHGTQRAERTVGNGITVTDAAGGLCSITFPAAQSAALAPGNYDDEIRVTTAGGFICVQAVGPITVAAAGASAAPPDLQAELSALKSARRKGLRGVTIEGYSVAFASDAEMASAIASIESEIAAAQGVAPVRNVYVRSRGWS